MLRTDISFTTEIVNDFSSTPFLVMRITSNNPCWSMEGELKIKGFSGQELDELEDALVSRLHGRGFLNLGPVETGSALDCNPGRELRSFSKRWGMGIDDWSTSTGLDKTTIKKLLNDKGKANLRSHTRSAFTTAMCRVVQHPKTGECLRLRRVGGNYSFSDMANALEVSEETLYKWEHDLEPIPEKMQPLVGNLYGFNSMFWATTDSSKTLAPLSITTPPPWGSESIEDRLLEAVSNE